MTEQHIYLTHWNKLVSNYRKCFTKLFIGELSCVCNLF